MDDGWTTLLLVAVGGSIVVGMVVGILRSVL